MKVWKPENLTNLEHALMSPTKGLWAIAVELDREEQALSEYMRKVLQKLAVSTDGGHTKKKKSY